MADLLKHKAPRPASKPCKAEAGGLTRAQRSRSLRKRPGYGGIVNLAEIAENCEAARALMLGTKKDS